MVSDFFSAPESILSNPESKALRERGKVEQFLRFHLVPNTTMMLPIPQLTEVLKIPTNGIIPIPHMPAWVIGVYNWRGEILWTIDLGHLVGLVPWYRQGANVGNFTAIVLHGGARDKDSNKTTKQTLALVVNRVEDIEWCNPDTIQSPPVSIITTELAPFLQGYWLKSNGDMVLAIDGNAIIAAMPKT
jgi:positive phototaxis protein PixI